MIIQHTTSCRKLTASMKEKHQDAPNSSSYINEKELWQEGDRFNNLMAPPSEDRDSSSPPKYSTFTI